MVFQLEVDAPSEEAAFDDSLKSFGEFLHENGEWANAGTGPGETTVAFVLDYATEREWKKVDKSTFNSTFAWSPCLHVWNETIPRMLAACTGGHCEPSHTKSSASILQRTTQWIEISTTMTKSAGSVKNLTYPTPHSCTSLRWENLSQWSALRNRSINFFRLIQKLSS
jgi:hypothetical protein